MDIHKIYINIRNMDELFSAGQAHIYVGVDDELSKGHEHQEECVLLP